MKITVHKKAKPSIKPKATISPVVQQRMKFVAGDNGGSHAWVGAALVAAVVLLAIGIAVAKSSHTSWPQNGAPVVAQTSAQTQKESTDMGGLSMAEWMKLHNTNNALLKARQEAVKARTSGKTQ